VCLGMRILLVVGGEVIGCAAEALHRGRHFDSLCYVCWSRKIEGVERFSWAQRDARAGEMVISDMDLQCVLCSSDGKKSCKSCSYVLCRWFNVVLVEVEGWQGWVPSQRLGYLAYLALSTKHRGSFEELQDHSGRRNCGEINC
jgi:hypothetical protein